ncbi:MAG: Rrf2 family transcriptional regulator [Acidobacteriaceae bacterium]|nr:Rrf2 family transcriptional regulator [Acidobacteriaceae bacterium]MBV8570091.1 Rrf2 family transcriptional regulator [Acidobacteriaceae bacterium]
MNQLSKRCKYALRALYRLNREYSAGVIPVIEIAESENIPRKFLETILVQLRNAGIVESQLGKNGGYRLAKSPDAITIGAVVRVVDGPIAPLPCVREKGAQICEECTRQRCETRFIMRQVRDAIAGVLDHTTLVEACARSDEDALTYEI